MASEAKMARTMHPEEHAESGRGPSVLPCFLTKEVLPTDLIIYLGNFMKFEDYVRFIRVLWPNNDEDQSVRLKLLKMSAQRLRCQFINGKYLEIEYNYDTTRTFSEQLLINVNTLLPVFGGQVPPDTERFMKADTIRDFVTTSVRLNELHNYLYASCPCHLDVDPEAAREFKALPDNECTDRHFHHFCSQHVDYWLFCMLELPIRTLEKGTSFSEDLYSIKVNFARNSLYFQGKNEVRFRPTSYFTSRQELLL
ncbi:repeat element protein-d3.1 [Ichnoviriform fugitivi]|uniref:Repeat element protein-d3.1 n=1 Tax=Ichnoviriform fugitivi TaxID=265522 RepID=A2Q0K0_9VIRU|nr:repeat element protein-d3.1 [Ichnoviriform fugitivi]BAF45715.1 repeat element protein-d3.1 [Ichnoviriform fugitivi]